MRFYAARRFQNDAVVSSVGRSLPGYRSQTSVAGKKRTWGANLNLNYIHRYRDFRRDGWEVGRYSMLASSVSDGFAKTSELGDLRVTLGLENILDRDPPLDNPNVGYNQGLVGRPGGRFGYLSERRAF